MVRNALEVVKSLLVGGSKPPRGGSKPLGRWSKATSRWSKTTSKAFGTTLGHIANDGKKEEGNVYDK